MAILDLLFQIAGLTLLIGGIGFGYWRWVARYGPALEHGQRAVLMLLIMTLMGGLIGSPVWWFDDPRGFAWDLPPLAGRMLGAAGWSFVALCLAVLARPTPQRIRLALIMLAVYLAPLAAAILIWHLDRFDPRQPITYVFFAIVGTMLAANLWFLVRPPRPLPGLHDDPRRPQRFVTLWLDIVAVITGVWGLALFVTDRGPSELIWAWPGDLLTSRLIAVMLLTIMAGALLSRRSIDLSRIILRVTIVYALGLACASLWGLLVGQPLRPGYAVVFALIAIGSLYIIRTTRDLQALPDSGATSTG